MHPNPGIVYRTIGGVLDMYFFFGPTPENTAQQYTEVRSNRTIRLNFFKSCNELNLTFLYNF